MYLSKLKIKNFRSIKELDIVFEKGKNVIIGKNNSGKSNIIKAIDIVLGEQFPAYNKSQNITENDFNDGNLDDPIFIVCELVRDASEDLNYEEMYSNCFGFFLHGTRYSYQYDEKNNASYTLGEPITHQLNEDSFWEDIEQIFSINKDDPSIKTYYINGKARSFDPFKKEFQDCYSFAYAFKAKADENGTIEKDIRFLYRKDSASKWRLCFSAPIRNEFLQSAIIPAFRDTNNQLRITKFSWYGKLLRHFTNKNHEQLKEAFDSIKKISEDVFQPLITEINDPQTCVAFPDTKISFECTPDSKIDLYKNVLVYVNDGFNSLLNDKGAGIQSTVVIGLFEYYTRNIAHCNCSLLGIEEPELYLHPHGRRVISYRLDNFIDSGKNQVILTTHSSEFITSAHENVNLIVVKKETDSGTTAINSKISSPKEKQILVKLENSEMFFADKVLLVEGGEKYILESLAKKYGVDKRPDLGENWINDKNISIIAVGGKNEFCKYVKKLNELSIKNYIMADFDFLFGGMNEYLKYIDAPPAYKYGLEMLKNNIIDITTAKKAKKIDDVSSEDSEKIIEFIDTLKDCPYEYNHTFILRKELENYYTDKAKSGFRNVHGAKEMMAIQLVSELVNGETDITDLIDSNEYYTVFDMICSE